MSQVSDESMADQPPEALTDSQLDDAANAFLAADPSNDLEGNLAGLVVDQSANIPPASAEPAAEPAAEAAPGVAVEDEDATGKNNDDDEDEDDEEEDDEEAPPTTHLEELIQRGGQIMSGLQTQQSQESILSDDSDYVEEQVRKEFSTIKTSTWMAKKIDAMTGDLAKLVKEHEKSKKDMIKPVKEMMRANHDMKQSLTILTGLLSDACTNGDIRDMFIESSKVLSAQEKIVEKVKTLMQTIELGKVILEEKKCEEANKRGESSSTMSAAAALLGSGSKKQRKK